MNPITKEDLRRASTIGPYPFKGIESNRSIVKSIYRIVLTVYTWMMFLACIHLAVELFPDFSIYLKALILFPGLISSMIFTNIIWKWQRI